MILGHTLVVGCELSAWWGVLFVECAGVLFVACAGVLLCEKIIHTITYRHHDKARDGTLGLDTLQY